MENLLELDRQLFYLINQLPHSDWLNSLALVLSGVGTGGLIWVVGGAILFILERKHKELFFHVLVAVALSLIVSEGFLKPLFGRIRPGDAIGSILIGVQSLGHSFPSSHATVAFAAWYVLMKFNKAWSLILFLFAASIALSRVYLGRHYPFDIVVGACLGVAIGWLTLYGFSLWLPKKKRRV